MKRIMIAMGTRPEAIKLCPLVKELRARNRDEITVLSTGQHREMLDSALTVFGIKPDYELDVMRTGQTLSDVTARILRRTDEVLVAERPDLLLVQGDTTTAFATALAAFHRHIRVGHVEAGLRTYRMYAPFPEELYRQAIGLFADYHFAPTVAAKKNLIREGKHEATVYVTGNTVVDALRMTLAQQPPPADWSFLEGKRLLIFTAHRRENIGTTLCGMLSALRRIVDAHPDIVAIFPVHHNPEVRGLACKILHDHPRIRMMEPPQFVTFHHLLARATLIMTDSGGIQEEACALGVPTMVLRNSSERTEGLMSGVLKLAGTDEEGIVSLAERLLDPDSDLYPTMKKKSSVYGDGKASVRIADILERL